MKKIIIKIKYKIYYLKILIKIKTYSLKKKKLNNKKIVLMINNLKKVTITILTDLWMDQLYLNLKKLKGNSLFCIFYLSA